MGEYMGTVMLLPTRIIYKDHLQLLPTNCYLQFLRILNSLPLWQTSTIPRGFPIIPWKFPIINTTEVSDNTPEDTGTYDNTTEVSDNTTENSNNNVPKLKGEDTGTYDNATENSDNNVPNLEKIPAYMIIPQKLKRE